VPNKGLPVIKLRVPSEKFRLGKAEERDRSAHEMTFPAYQSDPIPYEIQTRWKGYKKCEEYITYHFKGLWIPTHHTQSASASLMPNSSPYIP
jgi:hypothetical protein